MSEIPVGGLDGGSVTCPNNGEYYVSVHGYDEVDGFDHPYDQITYKDSNRWHLQGHFGEYPDSDRVSYNADSVDYKIVNPDSDNNQEFRQIEPNSDQISQGGDVRFPKSAVAAAFGVTAGVSPYLTASAQALIELSMGDGGDRDDVIHDPYDYVEWSIPYEWGSPLPTAQDDAAGARVNIFNRSESSNRYERLEAYSELSYTQYYERGYSWYKTGTASCEPYYYPV